MNSIKRVVLATTIASILSAGAVAQQKDIHYRGELHKTQALLSTQVGQHCTDSQWVTIPIGSDQETCMDAPIMTGCFEDEIGLWIDNRTTCIPIDDIMSDAEYNSIIERVDRLFRTGDASFYK